jgi:hypothetical protein
VTVKNVVFIETVQAAPYNNRRAKIVGVAARLQATGRQPLGVGRVA